MAWQLNPSDQILMIKIQLLGFQSLGFGCSGFLQHFCMAWQLNPWQPNLNTGDLAIGISDSWNMVARVSSHGVTQFKCDPSVMPKSTGTDTW
jgi:hypothetical protein